MKATVSLDLGHMLDAHRAMVAATRHDIATAIHEASVDGLVYSRQHQGFTNRTGKLTTASRFKIVRVGNRVLKAEFSNPMSYAAPIDKGARPHVIEASRAPYLVFFWKKISRWVRLKKVNHPGNKPYAFLWIGADYAAVRFGTEMKRNMGQSAVKF